MNKMKTLVLMGILGMGCFGVVSAEIYDKTIIYSKVDDTKVLRQMEVDTDAEEKRLLAEIVEAERWVEYAEKTVVDANALLASRRAELAALQGVKNEESK